ncbi:MAG: transporter, DctM subunit [Deltaproteobacteria bacterium]|nr:transporter, DctM subunit [Deltaproteobacteria bacterium]
MDPLFIGLIMVVLLVAAILSGIYVGVSLAFLGFLGVWWMSGDVDVASRLVGTTAFTAIMDYTFTVLPFFVAMGLLASVSGAGYDLYMAANAITGRVRGGLGIGTVLANAVFAAITGVSVASAAIFSKISLPEMLRHGYDKKFALGVVAGSSVLGMLIPPSVLFIIYGVLSEEAIGRLFIAGVIPGLILVAIYSLGIFFMVWRRPGLIKQKGKGEETALPKSEGKGIMAALRTCWGIVVLIIVSLGGIWMGFFTPTEAGAVGAFGALILGFAKRRINKNIFWKVLYDTGITTAGVFFLLISAQVYSRMIALSGLVNWMSVTIKSLPIHPLGIIIIFLIIFLILGCLMDSASIMLLALPLMLPVVKTLGFDLIWFGVVSVVVIEMGILTPPFGMVVFAMKAALGEEARIEEIFQGSIPFLWMMALFVIILMFFPKLSTWLPGLM